MLRSVPTRAFRENRAPRSTSAQPELAQPVAPGLAPVLVLMLAFAFATACGETQPDAPPARPAATSTASAPAAEANAKPDANVQRVASRRNERPLPAFEGRTLEGNRIAISDLIGKRLVLFFFNPEVDTAEIVARAVAAVAAQRSEFNFDVLGIAVGSNSLKTREFVARLGLDFPVIDDSSGRVTGKIGLRAPVALLSVDTEGFLGDLAMSSFSTESEDAWKAIAAQIRDKLRIASPDDALAGALDQRPTAPPFETPRLAGGDPFALSSMQGKPLVLIFFLHTCPHCHSALQFLQEQIAALPEEKRPAIIGISVSSRAGNAAVLASLREHDIDVAELTLLSDPTSEVAGEYGVFAGVPVIYLIDRDGKIVQRIQGWDGGREKALVRMQLAQIAGARIPMLLNPKGYTGSDVCGVCHVNEYNSWQFTNHSSAYDTLVTHGKERDAECVSCHVAGFDQPGGFTLEEKPHHLENVSCENCHGRGGPHLSPGFVTDDNYENACLSCHNQEHSLGFEYAKFLPSISHKAIAGLSATERAEIFAARGTPRDVLPQTADHVGSEACESCHSAEFATWSSGGHAHAGETLTKADKAADADCLACHTTGFDRAGGFPVSATLADHPDLGRVGCESCHGPGGDHIKQGSQKIGSIVSLGDKCDSCVILQICGRCHDDANDSGFEFEVEEKIELQRHGTIEAGTGKPIGASASAQVAPRVESELAQAFSLLDDAERSP